MIRNYDAHVEVDGYSVGPVWHPSMHEIGKEISFEMETLWQPQNKGQQAAKRSAETKHPVMVRAWFNGHKIEGPFTFTEVGNFVPAAGLRAEDGIIATRLMFEGSLDTVTWTINETPDAE